MNPAIGAAVISGLGGLLGGLFNTGSSNTTNRTNLQIARETNRANEVAAYRNREWMEKMWHQQNAYNSPSSQMARYTAAGLNPNLIYGQGSNGNATSIGNPPTPTYQAAHMEAPRPGDAIIAATQGVVNALEYDLRRKDLESQVSLRQSQEAAQRAKVYETNANVLDILQRAARTRQQRLQADSLFSYQLEAQRLNTELVNQQLISSKNDNSIFDLKKQYYETQVRLLDSGVVKNEMEAKDLAASIWKKSQEVLNLAEQRNQIRQMARHTLNENLFLEATRETRIQMVAQELTGMYIEQAGQRLRNQAQSFQNDWHGRYGFSKGHVPDFLHDTEFNIRNIGSAFGLSW